MKALIQRVDSASVTVEGEVVGAIGKGLLVLLGAAPGDTGADVAALAAKLVDLRVFADDEERFNRSLRDVAGSMLVVSQFTLFGDARKGRRPGFTGAAQPEIGEPLVGEFVEVVRGEGIEVATGRFGAMMEVELVNNGPFTMLIETANGKIL